MGIQDRDYYREARPTTRGPGGPSIARVALFWIALLAILFAAFRLLPNLMPRPPASVVAPMVTAPVVGPPPNVAPVSPPVRPAPYESRAPAPPSAIYRCGNQYSREPCPGGRVVDAPAASGFDSRPSDRLARLVEDGRSGDNESTTTRTIITTSSIDRSDPCQALAAEITSIDRQALQPQFASWQDRLRAQRQQARDRQVAQRC